MYRLNKHQLRAKGWLEEEIIKTEKILKELEEEISFSEYLKLTLLITAFIIINAVLLLETTFMLFATPPVIYFFILIIISTSVSSFFSHIIIDFHWLEKKHWLSLFIITIITSFLTFYLLTEHYMKLGIEKTSPITAAIIYSLGLLMPFLITFFTDHQKRK